MEQNNAPGADNKQEQAAQPRTASELLVEQLSVISAARNAVRRDRDSYRRLESALSTLYNLFGFRLTDYCKTRVSLIRNRRGCSLLSQGDSGMKKFSDSCDEELAVMTDDLSDLLEDRRPMLRF